MIKPGRPKRFSWWRKYFGFWDHPKWEVVGRHAQVPTLVAGAIADKLCECAAKGKPKGSLNKWSAAECAASLKLWQLEMDARDVDRVYGALEAFGWIDQGFIPEWYERQPDDPTAAERMVRWRSKRDREGDRKRDQRDRHAANQRAYRLRKKANGLAGAERVTGDVTPKSQEK